MILFRSIFFELWTPFFVIGGVMSFLLIMQNFYKLASLYIEKGLRAVDVGLMLAYLMPEALSITIPLGVIGAVFVTVIRLSVDAEMVTMRTGGKSMWGVVAPFFAFGAVTALLALVVSLWLSPMGFSRHIDLQVELTKTYAEQNLRPGKFITDFGDKVIQIGNRSENNEVSEIFIASRRHTPRSSVILADKGTIEVDKDAKKVFFRLRDGAVYFSGDTDETLNTVQFETLNYLLAFDPKGSVRVNPYKTMLTPKLVSFIKSSSPHTWVWSQALLELFQRLTLPLSCLVFAIASVPMAIVDTRLGKSGSYLRAIFLVLTYYVIWLGLKEHIRLGGGHPGLIWLPLGLIFLFGLFRVWVENGGLWWFGFFRRKPSPSKA